jgi:DNA mismatch repair protein MutS2
MEERALRVLEFFPFLQTLKACAATEVGQVLCLELRPLREKAPIELLLQETVEASGVLEEEGPLPLAGTLEVRPLLPRARAEGACLLPEELLAVRSTLDASSRVKRFLEKAPPRYPQLQGLGRRLPALDDLTRRLRAALGPRGEILDSASGELARIRREIQLARARIRSSLEALWGQESLRKIFQEQIITLRKDRYVLAVKAECKNALPGIIHDQSQSRATFFVEPLATVEENNDLNLLLQDEKEEERRILLELTAWIREESDGIAGAVELLGRLDLIFAKALYARSARGVVPELNEEGVWDLRRARHPLLDPGITVPVDLRLGKGQTTLILTGANTGGKTVSLKTLGLLTLMAQCGIPVPAEEGSRIAVVQKIFADIGDEQSLKDNLSTFSAWIRTMAHVLREAGASSLILLDEVGGGTDPAEGAALTMALIDRLRARGAKTAVTTHLHLLKAYGSLHRDVVNVSVEVNPETLRPTYRLIYGRPGESYALLMAEKYGMPAALIERAKSYLGEGDRKVGELLAALERHQQEWENKIREAEDLKKEAGADRERARDLLLRAKAEEEERLQKARDDSQRVIREAREEIRQMIREFKAKGQSDVHGLDLAIREKESSLRLTLSGDEEKREPGTPPRILRFGLDSRKAPPSAARASGPRGGRGRPGRSEEPFAGAAVEYEVPPVVRELKIIGLRVEEALPLVDKAIDEALLGGLRELEVIHGAGTGRLRKAVRDFLQEHDFVEGFGPGGPGRGGDGVTVVAVGPGARRRRIKAPRTGSE